MATTQTIATQITPVQALNRLTKIGLGFIFSQVFLTALDLGVFEELGNGPATREELARKLNIHPEGCRRLLSVLQHLELVKSDGSQYGNSVVGDFLTSKSPYPFRGLSMWGAPFYHMWEFFADALREYSPRWQQALGTTAQETFAALYEDPVRLRRFTELMNAYSILQGQEMARRLDFRPYRRLLDVAGGPGGIAIQIGSAYPHLEGIIMDLPPVCRIAEEHIQAAGLAGRFRAAPADLSEGPYPAGADIITLGYILHDWSDESCRKILGNCFAALPAGGTLLVVEKVLNDDYSGTDFALMADLHMLLVCESGACERTLQQYRSLLEEAGFRSMELVRFESPLRDVMIARKP